LEQLLFIPGREYKRTDIHQQYGGSGWGGISPSGKLPYIFIFSVPSGHEHGYKDRWENDDVFSYTGEGQLGNMSITRNNLALFNHKEDGKRVFLFIGSRKAFVRFDAELELIDFDFFTGLDKEGNQREAIKFFFKRVGVQLNYKTEHTPLSLVAEPDEIKERNVPTITERKGLVTSRVGQGAYRKSIMFRWNYKCAVTNYSKKEILIASHILPWKDSTNDERLDVDNGILLSPVYDALFDQKLISFENTGKIILSTTLENTNYKDLGVTGKEVIRKFTQSNCRYLQKHRESLQ
jgi:5-methylcytosine-specific restriction enzyme A